VIDHDLNLTQESVHSEMILERYILCSLTLTVCSASWRSCLLSESKAGENGEGRRASSLIGRSSLLMVARRSDV
jgi:hypothetical protein